ncbi:restriction endonuclease [Fibrisoma montanum]|uniref:Restriction endonuclease n=1 Tax=Fibrisoma montanum TaxID=2305895 RepID=A0A418ME21_9BACT|nr:HNH endonuclease [Fibrisoma montanum]RIV25026.1 restriction endonuclease [Fibrisoma montanum]
MSENALTYYLYAFTHLKFDKSKGDAPHKPVLLISILQAFERKLIADSQIYITPELTDLFKTNWNLLVTTNHTLGFALPFYHLKNERGGWWELVPKPGCEIWLQNAGSMKTFGNLNAAVAYAEIDQNLTILLKDEQSRTVLKQALLETYFPGQVFTNPGFPNNHLNDLKREMLEESPAEYIAKLKSLKTRLDPETYQIEVYSRDSIFRREIVRLYDDMCCITGARVSAPYSFSMVDACHIVPFYKTFNNHPANGIALCPNLHRAFDKGAISIDDDYCVIVSTTFVESENSAYNLKMLAGTQIHLPKDEQFLPDLKAFAWHREHTYKG